MTQTDAGQAEKAGSWHVYAVNDTWGHGGCRDYGLSLALDREGNPHMTYGRVTDERRHASWNGRNFTFESVSPLSDSGGGSALVFDRADDPHIAFNTMNGSYSITSQLQYATRVDDEWVVEPVDPAHYSMSGPETVSMVLDADDHPHVVYLVDNTAPWTGTTRYAKWTGASWHIVDVFGASVYSSLALDSAGLPHIGLGAFSYRVVYISPSGSSMYIARGLPGGPRSLALDRSDRPHLAYIREVGIPKIVGFAALNGTHWDDQTVDAATYYFSLVPLAFDQDDRPRLAYPGETQVKYASWNGSAWETEVVDTAAVSTPDLSFALDGDGNPHIAYFDFDACNLRYATKADLKSPPPRLAYAPRRLDFGTLAGGDAASRTFTVWNSGGRDLNYTVAWAEPWISSLSPSNGTSTYERDTVTVTIRTAGLSAGLHSSRVSIASNGGSGSVTVVVNVTQPTRPVLFDFDPDTLGLGSKGRWVTAYLSPVNASPGDIDSATLLLNDILPPAWWDIQGGTTLMVKFDRAAVEAILPVSDSVDVKVTGSWRDGESFEAHDTIRSSIRR